MVTENGMYAELDLLDDGEGYSELQEEMVRVLPSGFAVPSHDGLSNTNLDADGRKI
jgi:hypothetical protein